VTPIDWKLPSWWTLNPLLPRCHHSLVTPIDWKLPTLPTSNTKLANSHHSLVTPIDWKHCIVDSHCYPTL